MKGIQLFNVAAAYDRATEIKSGCSVTGLQVYKGAAVMAEGKKRINK